MRRVRLRLGAELQQRNIPPVELARRAGIAANTARALARGRARQLDLVVLERIAAALDMNPLDLLEVFEFEEEEEDRKTPALAVA
jgi:DNA-binding Xre family transcriptional regulator